MSGLKELRERVVTFFRTQPARGAVGIDLLAKEFKEGDLKKLVPDADAEKAAENAAAAKHVVPDKKAERLDYGRKAVLSNLVEDLWKEGTLTRRQLTADEGTGMGYFFPGEYTPDAPAGQKPKIKELRIDEIKVDSRIQQRDGGIDQATVDEYALVHDRLPPVRVFQFKHEDTGELVNLLSRGFHRIAAKKQAGCDTIPCEIFEGTRDDAILDACGDNATHGRRRTSKDIVKAVRTLLNSKFYRQASTSMIAAAVQIAWGTADKIIKKIDREENRSEEEKAARGKGKDGKSYSRKKTKTKTAEKAPEARKSERKSTSGLKDLAGHEVPDDVAPIFQDTRFTDACNTILDSVKFLRELRTDTYQASSLNLDERKEALGEIFRKVETLMLSAPFSIVPENADVATAIARRKFMTKSEYEDWKKKGKKTKADKAEAAAAPAGSQAEKPEGGDNGASNAS